MMNIAAHLTSQFDVEYQFPMFASLTPKPNDVRFEVLPAHPDHSNNVCFFRGRAAPLDTITIATRHIITLFSCPRVPLRSNHHAYANSFIVYDVYYSSIALLRSHAEDG